MMTRNLEHQFFCQSLKITSDILHYIRYSVLQCHLAAAFCFIINVAWFIFSDLSFDAWAFSCVYTKRYIIYGQNSQSQEFQQNNLLKSCIGSLVESENCNRTASPPDLAHCAPPPFMALISIHFLPYFFLLQLNLTHIKRILHLVPVKIIILKSSYWGAC